MNFQLPIGWYNRQRHVNFFRPSKFEMKAIHHHNGRRSHPYQPHPSNIQPHAKEWQLRDPECSFRSHQISSRVRAGRGKEDFKSETTTTQCFLDKEFRDRYYLRVNAEITSCLTKVFGNSESLSENISRKLAMLSDIKVKKMAEPLETPYHLNILRNHASNIREKQNFLENSKIILDESMSNSSMWTLKKTNNRKVNTWIRNSMEQKPKRFIQMSPYNDRTSEMDETFTSVRSSCINSPSMHWSSSPLVTGRSYDPKLSGKSVFLFGNQDTPYFSTMSGKYGCLTPNDNLFSPIDILRRRSVEQSEYNGCFDEMVNGLRNQSFSSPLATGEFNENMNESFLSPIGTQGSWKFDKFSRMTQKCKVSTLTVKTTLTQTTRVVRTYSFEGPEEVNSRKLFKRRRNSPDEEVLGFHSKRAKLPESSSTSYYDLGYDEDVNLNFSYS